MNRKLIYLALVAIIGIALSSCSLLGGDKDPSYSLSDLQGLWLENGTQHYVRFTTEQSDETGYLYGREWNEDEDKYEQDLLDAAQKLGHPGNGWFKYKLDRQDLLEIHLQDNQGAEVPKSYVVSKLTDTDLVYYEKDRPALKSYFTKQVETKQ